MSLLGATSLTGCSSIPDFIASGTMMLFQQTASPTSWTKSTTHDNKSLRVVNGTASSGGTSAFSAVFASRSLTGSIGQTTAGGSVSSSSGQIAAGGSVSSSSGQIAAGGSLSGGSVGGTTLTTNQIPSHTHSYNSVSFGSGLAPGSFVTGSGALTTGATGGSNSHTHPFSTPSFSGTQHAHPVSSSFSGTQHDHPVSSSFSGTQHDHPVSLTNLDFDVQYVDVIFASKD
jgi:hypothetical protein